MMDTEYFGEKIGEIFPVFLQKEEIIENGPGPDFSGSKDADPRRVGKDIFQRNMTFRFGKGNFSPFPFDKKIMGIFAGKGALGEIFLLK